MTFSLVAHDTATGELGVAVQSHWFSVGAVVPHVRQGVGAVASQSVPVPGGGARLLDLLAPGNAELLFWAGLSAAHAGDVDGGVARVRRAIARNPGLGELLGRLGEDLAPAAPAVRARCDREARVVISDLGAPTEAIERRIGVHRRACTRQRRRHAPCARSSCRRSSSATPTWPSSSRWTRSPRG